MVKEYEKSSGGIVYRKKGKQIEILLLKWLNSRDKEIYVIPKGQFEDGEVARETAMREICEECGFKEKDLTVIKFVTKLSYTFIKGYLKERPLVDKDIYLFLFRYDGNDIPKVEEDKRFVGYEWVSLKKLKKIDVKFDMYSIVKRNLTYFI